MLLPKQSSNRRHMKQSGICSTSSAAHRRLRTFKHPYPPRKLSTTHTGLNIISFFCGRKGIRKGMTNHLDKHNRAPQSRLRFTYVILALSLGLFVVALLYSAWAKNREHDANMPVPAPEAVVVALRTFHRQTGRFPKDFRELDERLWKGTRQAQISADGTSLVAPSSHYYYTLHTINRLRESFSNSPKHSTFNL